MDKKQKIALVFTYIIAIVMMPVLYTTIPSLAGMTLILPEALGIHSEVLTYLLTVFFSFVILFIFWLIFKRRKFKSVFSFRSCKKEVYIGYLIALSVDIICLIISTLLLDGKFKALVLPSLFTFAFSLSAGVLEETSFRAVPVAIFMKNNPSSKRIVIALVVTSIGFALAHVGNVGRGASVEITTLQVFSCLITGFFLAVIYLRTGSILLSMIYHFFHDFINMMLPAQSTGAMLQASISVSDLSVEIAFTLVELIVGIYLIRKSTHEDIKKRWKDIWQE